MIVFIDIVIINFKLKNFCGNLFEIVRGVFVGCFVVIVLICVDIFVIIFGG